VSIEISCRQVSDIDNSDENDKEEDEDYDHHDDSIFNGVDDDKLYTVVAEY